MSESRKQYDYAFKAGAVRIVLETGQTVAQVARELDVNERTLAGWVQAAREGPEVGPDSGGRLLSRGKHGGGRELSKDAEIRRLRAEVEELRMERDVLKRSVVLWVKEATK
jgi:transposase